MALGFSYTLSPDETASWTEFQKFAKKISDEKPTAEMRLVD